MAKRVYPNEAVVESPNPTISAAGDGCSPSKPIRRSPEAASMLLTVWRKSLLFNCDGFTVFDGKGNLIYRVDNYTKSGNKGEIVLMDAAGNSLLTIRRKKLSLGEHWQIYNGEEAERPLFSVRKHVRLIQSKCLAHVTSCRGLPPAIVCDAGEGYEVEGSYAQRRCRIYDGRAGLWRRSDGRRRWAAGLRSASDVFRLIVRPGFDPAVAMAIVILLEEMFGSKSSLIKFQNLGFQLLKCEGSSHKLEEMAVIPKSGRPLPLPGDFLPGTAKSYNIM
ncbi:Protein LURP-one-related 8 [Platanthera zijinensis]|uniref:Protein LURP-one-related 8 n=1 Tax=Platanthera zijinensis TaxID=2320716 RepID=A0AAP0B5L2_9ASPA